MSLEQELRTEQVNHLDLSDFSLVVSGTSVRDALAQVRHEKHNVCLVTRENELLGIFTDRDVLRKVVPNPETLDNPIDEVMTPNPITIGPTSSAAEALVLMDENHFRNLPAMDDEGNIIGNMTHQAVLSYLAARYPVEVLNRPLNPEQFPSKAEGG